MDSGGAWELDRFASWLNGLSADSSSSSSLSLSSVLPEKQVTRDGLEVPELAKARGAQGHLDRGLQSLWWTR